MSGEKTEKPTDKKKQDSKKKGQVAISKDAQTVFRLLIFFIVFFWMSEDFEKQFAELLDVIVQSSFSRSWVFDSSVTDATLELLMAWTLPILLAAAVAGLVSTIIQTGFVVAPEAVTPSFKKLDAVQHVKDMFSKKSLVQLLLSVAKVIVLTLVGWLMFQDMLSDIVQSFRVGLQGALHVLRELIEQIVYVALGIFIVLALIDWAVVYAHHIKSIKMSIQDIKDEQKQSYGNPETKQRVKKEQRNILNSSLNRVGGAKAVVANPTHISVALDYEPGKHDLPYIVAMGVDEDAMDIRREAKRHGVPVIVNVKLARMLYADCEEDEYIRKQHLELAAEVFRTLMELNVKKQSDLKIAPQEPSMKGSESPLA